MGKNQDPDPESGMNIPDHISDSLETIFWIRNTKFFDPDLGSGNLFDLNTGWRNYRIRDP